MWIGKDLPEEVVNKAASMALAGPSLEEGWKSVAEVEQHSTQVRTRTQRSLIRSFMVLEVAVWGAPIER